MIKIFIALAISFSAFSTSPAPTYAIPNGNSASGPNCMALLPQCMGNTSQTRPANNCIHCQSLSTPNWGFNMMNPYLPWWYSYGRYNYPNFASPGVYQGGGLSHHYYPGPGNMAAGKPNLYFHGLDNFKEDIRFQVDFSKSTTLLASSPSHTKDGWIFKGKDGKINVSDANYEYIYYDYKLDSDSLQNTRGFCGERSDIYRKMVSALNEMRFKDKEITDFENYWAIKLPKGNFCVFPQTHDDLNKIAKWNSSIIPSHFKRILFVVIPQKNMKHEKFSHFSNIPKMDWNPLSAIYRVPSSKEDFQIHEWGIAFMVTNKK